MVLENEALTLELGFISGREGSLGSESGFADICLKLWFKWLRPWLRHLRLCNKCACGKMIQDVLYPNCIVCSDNLTVMDDSIFRAKLKVLVIVQYL